MSKPPMAEIHGTCVDESGHTLKSPIPTEIPVSLKNLSRGRSTGFTKQEILFLAKAFIHASTDPIIGTSQTEQQFFQKVCNIYNQQAANYNEQNATVKNFIPFTSQSMHSLKSHFNRCLQPAVQKFVGIKERYKMKSGKNVEMNLTQLMHCMKKQ